MSTAEIKRVQPQIVRPAGGLQAQGSPKQRNARNAARDARTRPGIEERARTPEGKRCRYLGRLTWDTRNPGGCPVLPHPEGSVPTRTLLLRAGIFGITLSSQRLRPSFAKNTKDGRGPHVGPRYVAWAALLVRMRRQRAPGCARLVSPYRARRRLPSPVHRAWSRAAG